MKIGLIVQRWRWSTCRSQTSVANEIGISKATMHRIEMGRDVDASTFLKLINWLAAKSEKGE